MHAHNADNLPHNGGGEEEPGDKGDSRKMSNHYFANTRSSNPGKLNQFILEGLVSFRETAVPPHASDLTQEQDVGSISSFDLHRGCFS